MAIDKLNNVLITGMCFSSPSNRDMITVKYNTNGVIQWVKSYSSFGNRTDWGYSIVIDDSCNVYASGYGGVLGGNRNNNN